MYLRSVASLAAAIAGLSGISPAGAQDQTPPAAPAADQTPAAPAHPVWEGIQFSGHVEAGATVSNNDPSNNINFGQGFTDRADTFRMNQAMLTAEHDLDPKATGIDLGFKFQTMYGTDARYTHFLGELDRATRSPYQWDIVEANGQVHLPIVGAGGMDLKVGQYSTPLGYEVIDATGNPLYSHSYIFIYGLPFKHTGGLTTTHVNDTLDIWAGIDSGVNTSVGAGDNNGAAAFLYGFGLNNLLDGNLSVLALSHIGPENPTGTLYSNGKPVPVNRYVRQYYDTVITYKFNDTWTEATELNMVKDDAFGVTAGGGAQYVLYTLNDQWSFTGRGEVFADQAKNGFAGFVCAFPSSEDVIGSERNITIGANPHTPGEATNNTSYCGGTANGGNYNLTYSEFTIGANYKPPIPYGANLTIRPEVRYDAIIGGGSQKPFNVGPNGVGRSTGAFTTAVDFILGF